MALDIALAFGPNERPTMARSPRPRDEPLLSGDLVWPILLIAGLFLGDVFAIKLHAVEQGDSIELVRSNAMNIPVVMEIFHLL